MHWMGGNANALAVDQCHRFRATGAQPEEFHRVRKFRLSGIGPEQTLPRNLAMEAEQLAFVEVQETSSAARIRAFRNHRVLRTGSGSMFVGGGPTWLQSTPQYAAKHVSFCAGHYHRFESAVHAHIEARNGP